MQEKIIMVTGASSGIGYALAKDLASAGHQVLAVARREARLHTLASEHENITPVTADISLASGRKNIIEKISELNKPIDIVNNAGIAMPKSLELLTEAEWQQAFKTNIDAPYWLFRDCLPYFSNSRILNVSTGLAHSVMPGVGVYSMTKAALYMLYLSINADMDPGKVIAGSIRPGIIDTEMQQVLRSKEAAEFPSVARFKEFHQQNQLRSAEEVAAYIANILCNTSDEEFKAKEWNIDA